MRRNFRRNLLGAALVFAGFAGLKLSQAADPKPEAELKALVEQDAKNIDEMIKLGLTSSKKGDISRATRAVKSNAMMIAYYANSQIGGKNGADDAKFSRRRATQRSRWPPTAAIRSSRPRRLGPNRST